jgi:hypothetical protein
MWLSSDPALKHGDLTICAVQSSPSISSEARHWSMFLWLLRKIAQFSSNHFSSQFRRQRKDKIPVKE